MSIKPSVCSGNEGCVRLVGLYFSFINLRPASSSSHSLRDTAWYQPDYSRTTAGPQQDSLTGLYCFNSYGYRDLFLRNGSGVFARGCYAVISGEYEPCFLQFCCFCFFFFFFHNLILFTKVLIYLFIFNTAFVHTFMYNNDYNIILKYSFESCCPCYTEVRKTFPLVFWNRQIPGCHGNNNEPVLPDWAELPCVIPSFVKVKCLSV